MEPIQVALAVALIAGITGLLFFIIRSVSAPKKVDGILKLVKQKKIPAAVKLAKQILAKDSKNYLAHYYLGKAYLADGKPELALMEYKVVNENTIFGQEISEIPFRKEISELYLKFNQTDDALREFILLTKLEPRNAEHFYSAGKIYEQQNRGDLALTAFQKAIMLDKRHAKAHAALGLILFRSKQFSEAKKEIDTALSLSPDTYSSYYYLGKIYKENKDYGSAVKAFEKAQRDPEYRQRAIIERGTCYMLVGRLDNAIVDLQRAIELDKTDSKQETLYARYFLASCYEKSRKIEKAIEQWEIIYKKNHSFRDVSTKLSEYRDIQSNDSLKEYLTCAANEFAEICKKTATQALSLLVQSCEIKKWGCLITAVEHGEDGWMNMRRQSALLQFYRNAEPLEDSVIRNTLDNLKAANCVKAYIFSSSGFTRTAAGAAEGRPVELIDKEQLEQMLQRSGI
ncbi:MAG: tetratricopeptide repeat protein [Treponema sp.]|nr:tetratricopeptide repeat protein [Treponema sp.]